ncbi:MAG: glycosyltransferase family 2 protein [Phycisphaeraceae bacterium]|nr:glycosyltransferase family 2 protein [Phycisphaeraceae bacterium]
MPPISISIICKDSVDTLPSVLEAVRPLVAGTGDDAGEILAVDSGSTDGTIELLERAGARIIRSEWLGHVRTKQLAMQQCVKPWILCLDSDEPPDSELSDSIVTAVRENDPRVSGFLVNRKVFFAGRFLDHCWQPEPRLRLVRKGFAGWTGIGPHDRLELLPGSGLQRELRGTLRHDSFRSFADHLEKQASYARLSAQALFERGERSGVLQIVTTAPAAFLKQVIIKSAWRDGWRGILAAASTAAGTLMKHIVLTELTMRERERLNTVASRAQDVGAKPVRSEG